MSMYRFVRLLWLLATLAVMFSLYTFTRNMGLTAEPQPHLIGLSKLSHIMLGGIAGGLLDIVLFPYSRPDGYLQTRDWACKLDGSCDGDADFPVASGYDLIFAATLIRRAVIVAACVIGAGLGM